MEFLAALVPLLASNLDQLWQELKSVYGLDAELERLQNSVSLIEAVLSDAQEKKQIRKAVSHLLHELRQAAYDANDILDEVATESQRCQLIKHASVRNSLGPVNLKRYMFKKEIRSRMRKIEGKLDAIVKKCPLTQLTPPVAPPRQQSDQTTSRSPPKVLGRENDKQKIKDLLMPVAEATDRNISVIPIFGMPGIGKTTLAQLVCHDDSVKNHFELTFWVDVSHDFYLMRIMKTIFESIDGFQCDLVSLDNLQRQLRKRLSGRRYLLVLDDVSQESQQEWERLKNFLHSGAQGSKIIVTTSNEEVAHFMTTSDSHRLQGLSDDDCWSLVCQYALTRDRNASIDLDGYRIHAVNRCRGLPSAAINLGHRLSRETDRSKWGRILRNEALEFSGAEMSSVYQHLPQDLKTCFAYFSIIPKRWKFEKEFIIQLWIAQNFIRPRGREQMEDIAGDHFDSLRQRSFFQYSHFDHKSRRHRYMMHDVVHLFARQIAEKECFAVDYSGTDWHGSASVRHLSLSCGESPQSTSMRLPSFGGKNIYKEVYGCQGLHTLLLTGSTTVPDDVAKRLGRLRTLSLCNSSLTQLPKSIGDLKHLRCLQLQNTDIKTLPENFTCLYNLQTLGLRNCYLLEKLPEDIRNLRNLRHIDLHLDVKSRMTLAPEGMHGVGLRSMPPEIGKLTNLRTLSRFIVSTRPECTLSQLSDMNNLRGELLIERLDLVFNAADAVEAKLAKKEFIDRLELTWTYNAVTETISVGYEGKDRVLENLRPHANLKELGIVGYGGTSLPTWIGDPSFSNLVTLWISKTSHCLNLPPLGQLPKLKDLYLKEMDAVKHLDCSLCGPNRTRFPSLEKLHLESMSGLELWWGDDDCALPCLREFVIKDCGVLDELSHKLPSLTKLVIEASRIPRNIQGRHALIRRLEISHCNQLLSVPDDCLPTGLSYFAVKHCPKLRYLPEGLTKLTTLEDLEIENCQQLQYLPIGLRNMTSLASLEISDCPVLRCSLNEGFPRNLQFLSISNCPELLQQWRDQGYFTRLHDLHVWIDGELVTPPALR